MYFMVHVGYVPVSNRRQTSDILSLDAIISTQDYIDMLNDRRINLDEIKQTTSNYLLTEIDKMSSSLLQTAIRQVTFKWKALFFLQNNASIIVIEFTLRILRLDWSKSIWKNQIRHIQFVSQLNDSYLTLNLKRIRTISITLPVVFFFC